MADSRERSPVVPDSGHPDLQSLKAFALGRLATDELERCAGHLEACATCRQYVEAIPADHLMALAQRTAGGQATAAPKLLQKYEVLEEIGRGGMAVVYKAWQVGLKRIVALKQIKADVIMAEGLARFRAEAGAMARVQHPNIVQIYDVGEQEGRPYLACEFVAGGSLDRHLTGNPLPTRAACRLVSTLARAVQVAHDHAVVHRDLKPSNVLLAQTGERGTAVGSEQFWESVVPKIGDFGLAKHLDQVHGQTQTGTVLGTPGYMAPEQVSGHSQRIGPGTDVFALGVILYELLTGRLPFQAATIVQTLEMIRTAEPVPPRRWLPTLPRDLDVICLKCLEKDPQRRYGRAGDLADDLERWREGKPILARPVSRWERGSKWARRHPLVSGLLTVVTMAIIALFAGLFWHNRTLEAEVRRANANESAALGAYRKGYDAIYELLNEATEEYADTETGDHRVQRLHEITRAYHAGALEGADDANPEVRFARASSRFFLGTMHSASREFDEAQRLLESAREELEEVRHEVRDQIEFKSRLAACSRRLALARFGASNVADATTIGDIEQACQLLEELVRSQPANFDFYRRRIGALHELAMLYLVDGQELQAEQAARKSRAIQKSLEQLTPLRTADRAAFERTFSLLGRLCSRQGRFQEAEEVFRDGEAMLLNLGDRPESSDVAAALADLFDGKCQLEQNRGRTWQALQSRARSIELLRQVLSEVPQHRFARNFLPAYEASRRELLSRLMGDDGAGTTEDRAEVETIAARLSGIRSLRIHGQFDEAAAQLQRIEARLLELRKVSNSQTLTKCLADANFEWAELHIAGDQFDMAVGRYDQCISLINEMAERLGDPGGMAEMLSNCHRLKAWHLSRAGLVDAAFAEWDRAIASAVGPTRDYLRAERAMERAVLHDHAGAVAEADQVADEPTLAGSTLLHLARVYSVALGAVQNDDRLAADNRQVLADYCADQALGCLRRIARGPQGDRSLLENLDADGAFAALRRNSRFKSWRRAKDDAADDGDRKK